MIRFLRTAFNVILYHYYASSDSRAFCYQLDTCFNQLRLFGVAGSVSMDGFHRHISISSFLKQTTNGLVR